ncbi:hypothetical protein ACJIZ3_007384 [Penstemon smallii]|uniref:Uncharacterized protein n=1 Tax=Penstemon smallii TaxID=265156 RepID=A0ABD3SAD2_9LAMI
MEAIKKQGSKLREQVARQQQTILRQLGQLGHEGIMFDEADMLRHQQLQNLYKSTRAAKHFQKDIVRGLEGFISTSKKQMEIARKLAEDCCKYGIENQDCGFLIASVASDFGTSHASMEDHRKTMLGILGYQVSEPHHALTGGAPLEDARHWTQRYDRMRQEFEIQAESKSTKAHNIFVIKVDICILIGGMGAAENMKTFRLSNKEKNLIHFFIERKFNSKVIIIAYYIHPYKRLFRNIPLRLLQFHHRSSNPSQENYHRSLYFSKNSPLELYLYLEIEDKGQQIWSLSGSTTWLSSSSTSGSIISGSSSS